MVSPSTYCTSRISILGIYRISIFPSIMSSVEEALARLPASAFSPLRTWINSTFMKAIIQFLTLFRYFFIRSSFVSQVPFTWPMTSYESLWTTTESTPIALAKFKPMMRASYSALLLVAWNCRRDAYFRQSPFGDLKIISIPPTCCVDDPSTWTIHCGAPLLFCWSLVGVNLAIKSASTWAFIASCGWYFTSNSLSSIAYWINCPIASNLFMAFLSGWSIMTLMTWAWK